MVTLLKAFKITDKMTQVFLGPDIFLDACQLLSNVTHCLV